MATTESPDKSDKLISRKRGSAASGSISGDASSPSKLTMFNKAISPQKLPTKKRKVYIHQSDTNKKTPTLLHLSSDVGVDLASDFGSDDDFDMRLPILPPRKKIEPIKSSPVKIPHIVDELPKLKVETSWRGHKIPEPLTRDQLDDAIDRHMKSVERVLDPKVQLPRYYDQIKQFQKTLTRETVRDNEEQWRFEWKQFYGGYIGPERQFYIGDKIMTKFSDQIRKTGRGDAVVQYLCEDNYVNYVLALELILELVAEQFGISIDEAMDAIAETRNYGTEISDKVKIA